MPAPLISVVLPVRNAAKTIERAVRSILKSSFKQIELIVIDDGSTDGSPEIINSIIDSVMNDDISANQLKKPNTESNHGRSYFGEHPFN